MWTLEKNKYIENEICINESLFALGNGRLGVRGCFEEQLEPSIRGTYINGFYDLIDAQYSEKLYGFPEVTERQVNVIETQTLLIYLDGEQVTLSESVMNGFKQSLYMDKGYTSRSYRYQTAAGKEAEICFRRLVSFVHNELFLIDLSVSYDGDIRIESFVEGDITTYSDDNDPRVGSHKEQLLQVEDLQVTEGQLDDHMIEIMASTSRSGLKLKVFSAIRNVESSGKISLMDDSKGGNVKTTITGQKTLSLSKYNVYLTDEKRFMKESVMPLFKASFEEHLKAQSDYMAKFWKDADVRIHGVDKAQQAIRYNIYQLMQSVGKDGRSNISAKGLTGEGYEGHTFWDTEIYILPVLMMSQPDLVKPLLMYRYNLIEASRERAEALGHKQGIKYPWRTIAGRECSTFFPAGTAQYHINGDVAYSFIQYYLTTGDMDFMVDYGYEVLLETSRLWLDIGHFYKDTFRIDAVTGPDEYSCVVNNNFYTNSLAKYGLGWMVALDKEIQKASPERYKKLHDKLQVTLDELDLFQKASDQMFLPYDKDLNIHLQDDHFLMKKQWDFKGTPKSHYPLLLHYHPLTIYRHQVIKQADTVLAHFLLEDEMPADVIRDSYVYYEKITTHDSSLSSCIYGIMATKIGEHVKGWSLVEDALYLDLENRHGNTKDGLHMANLGGSIMAILNGFMGYKLSDKGIKIAPYLPGDWTGIEFKIAHDGTYLDVVIDDAIHLSCESQDPVEIWVYDELHTVEGSVTLPLKH